MLKELFLAGMLSSVVYPQIQIGHNPEIEQKGSSEYDWQVIDTTLNITLFQRQTIPFSEKEHDELSEILSEIPLAEKLDALNYPIHIAKGRSYNLVGEVIIDKDNRFTEILLDTTMYGNHLTDILRKRRIPLDIDMPLFLREVLLHELVHAYYAYKYGRPENNPLLKVFNPHVPALAVECIYLADNGMQNTKLYHFRIKELIKHVYSTGHHINILSKEGEIKKIKGYMGHYLKEEDYKFLFE